MRKPKKRTTKTKAAKEPEAQPLPPADPTLEAAAVPAPEPEKKTILGSLFSSEAAVESSAPSNPPSTISSEQQAELNAVPDSIGGTNADKADAAGHALGSGDLGEMVEFLQSMGIDEDDMQEWLTEGCDFLSEKFKSDHWKLSDRQGRMLAKPYTAVANRLWVKILDWLPGFLGDLAKSSPEAAAMVISTAIVFGPKVAKQVVISRTRKAVPTKDKPKTIETLELGKVPDGVRFYNKVTEAKVHAAMAEDDEAAMASSFATAEDQS
jgi:hypothetical protein